MNLDFERSLSGISVSAVDFADSVAVCDATETSSNVDVVVDYFCSLHLLESSYHFFYRCSR